jgi:hypothetical protein
MKSFNDKKFSMSQSIDPNYGKGKLNYRDIKDYLSD